MQKILTIKNLRVHFFRGNGLFKPKHIIKAVNDISFAVDTGEILGIIGESGCGKSSLARALMGLNPINSGEVIFGKKKLHTLNKSQWRAVYQDMQLIFQDPIAALDPRMTILDIILEPLNAYRSDLNKTQKRQLGVEMMKKVGLDPEFINHYPAEFSGGQCQRVAIARALILKPQVLICDEAVSALDAAIKMQILQLLKDLQKEFTLTIIFISHDLGVVKHFCDRVLVMYLGRVMELSPSANLYTKPLHPYTQVLLNSVPTLDPHVERNKKVELLNGDLPTNIDEFKGCVFSSRCKYADAGCRESPPVLKWYQEIAAACFKISQ